MLDVLFLDAGANWYFHLALVPLVAAIGVAIILSILRPKQDPLSHLPRYEVKKGGTLHNQFPTCEALLRYAYLKHRDDPFVVGGSWRRWDTVILPPKLLDSIKSLPEDELSFYDALDTRFLHQFTTIKVPEKGGDTPMLKALAIDLTRHFNTLKWYLKHSLPDIADETDYAFDTLLPKCDDDWVEVYPMQVLPRILALVSGRILAGLPLSRNPNFIDLKLGFFKNSFIAMFILGLVPGPLRSSVARILPPIWGLKKAYRKMQQIMEPIIRQRKIDHEHGTQTKSDLLGWVIDNAPDHLKYNVRYQSHAQLITLVASIQSLYVATSHAWFDIAAHPEDVEALRDEWHAVLQKSPTGQVSFDEMLNARKLDSFYVLRREVFLKDGTLLPKGTYIGSASSQLGNDPTLWRGPEVFDAFRFEKLRNEPGNEGRFQFTSTGLDQLSFGYGRHPCPGRYYAGIVLKIMLAKLIDTYEVKLGGDGSRPRNVENWIALLPDDKTPVMLRKRKPCS